jgi:hypothetical protein
VRAFGEAENLAQLPEESLPDQDQLGWEMTAISAKLLESKGAYRCPWENGSTYVLYTSIGFVSDEPGTNTQEVECATHGGGFSAYVCEH